MLALLTRPLVVEVAQGLQHSHAAICIIVCNIMVFRYIMWNTISFPYFFTKGRCVLLQADVGVLGVVLGHVRGRGSDVL